MAKRRPEFGGNALDQQQRILRPDPELHAPGLEPGQIQQIAEQDQQPAGAGVNALQVAANLRFVAAGDTELCVGHDRMHRRAQFVRHVHQELALGRIGPLGRKPGVLLGTGKLA